MANASLQMALAPMMTGKNLNKSKKRERQHAVKITDSGNAHLQAFVSHSARYSRTYSSSISINYSR